MTYFWYNWYLPYIFLGCIFLPHVLVSRWQPVHSRQIQLKPNFSYIFRGQAHNWNFICMHDIHPLTQRLQMKPCKVPTCLSGTVRGSVSCSRTVRHLHTWGVGGTVPFPNLYRPLYLLSHCPPDAVIEFVIHYLRHAPQACHTLIPQMCCFAKALPKRLRPQRRFSV